jgi:putative mRNA 3-end processing factor
LHPAGHILGSAQVCLKRRGEICVVSGDYKTTPDRTCAPYTALRCHTFVSECTFGLPIYRWRPEQEVFDEINAWWRGNNELGRTSVLFAYALGKAQRVLSGLDASIGRILLHGAVAAYLPAYQAQHVTLPPTEYASPEVRQRVKGTRPKPIVLAPPSANGTPWLKSLGSISTSFASGWMQIRGARRRRAIDRGFVLSDHADFPGLCEAIEATGAEEIWATHGYTSVMVRWLTEHRKKARAIRTRYEGEIDESPIDADMNEQHEDASE